MTSSAKTVAEYIAGLPDDRRAAISKVRAVIRKNLPAGYAEQMQYGMIGYVVPHKLYPPGYHCKPEEPVTLASLGSQKNYMALYLMSAYQHEGMTEWIKEQFKVRGKKLDMGKSCIRFKKVEDLPLDVVGEAIGRVPVAEYIARYKAMLKK